MEKAKARAVGFSAFLVVLMLTVAIAFTAIALDGSKKDNGDPVGTSVVFAVPVGTSDYSVLKSYFFGLQKNVTTGRWEGHYAVDIGADAGTAVLATYDGTVSEVSYNAVNGKVVVIDHGVGGLQTVYKGLDEDSVIVSVGQAVKKNQPIAQVGNTMSSEAKDGNHIHIEVLRNGKKINPAEVIPISK
jgi:murein DD-endopeptidase MepM/ murein hydrolase activator NlpD